MQEEYEQEVVRRERELEAHRDLIEDRKKELLEQVRYEVAAERELLLRATETEAEQTRLAKLEETRAHVRGLVQEAADDVAKMRSDNDAELSAARNEIEQARNALRSERMLLRQQLTHLLEHARRLEMDTDMAGFGPSDWGLPAREISSGAPQTGESRQSSGELATTAPTKLIGRLLPPAAGTNGAAAGAQSEPVAEETGEDQPEEGELEEDEPEEGEALDTVAEQDEPDVVPEAER